MTIKKKLTDEQLDLHYRAMENHTPGKLFQFADGMIYKVLPTGAWSRQSVRPCSNSTNLKNNGVRRRLQHGRV